MRLGSISEYDLLLLTADGNYVESPSRASEWFVVGFGTGFEGEVGLERAGPVAHECSAGQVERIERTRSGRKFSTTYILGSAWENLARVS